MDQKNNVIKIICIIGFIIIFILISLFIVLFIKPKKYTPNASSQNLLKGDINHDGNVDYIDQKLVQDNLNCQRGNQCWTKEIAKTSDGDNPIYVYDLDANKNNHIDSQDIPH